MLRLRSNNTNNVADCRLISVLTHVGRSMAISANRITMARNPGKREALRPIDWPVRRAKQQTSRPKTNVTDRH